MNSGKSATAIQDNKQLRPRDIAILNDVMLYKLTTNAIVRVRYMPTASENATAKITSRLVRDGWLNSQRHSDNRLYFVLGRLSVKQFGLSLSQIRPLGVQSLASYMSVANYCCDPDQQFLLCGPSAFTSTYSWVPLHLRKLPHVVESGGDQLVLRTIRIDLGGTPSHVANKCAHDLKIRRDIPGYRVLRADRRWIHVILTTTENKKRLIEKALKKRPWPENTRFEIVVTPCLCSLLPN